VKESCIKFAISQEFLPHSTQKLARNACMLRYISAAVISFVVETHYRIILVDSLEKIYSHIERSRAATRLKDKDNFELEDD